MEAAAAPPTTLCALPLALLQSVLARLPVDAHARACVVCRAWNAALAERSPWTRLDLSPASGVAIAVTDKLLEAAAARAGGQLEAIDCGDGISSNALLAVVTASSATLRELRWHNPSAGPDERERLDILEVEVLLRAAPQLRMFEIDADCFKVKEASPLLRGELLFARVRVRALMVCEDDIHPDEAEMLAFAADVTGHAWLTELILDNMVFNTAAALDALVDAALARRLRAVVLWNCQLPPASAPALVRLLGGGLARLALVNMQPCLDVPAALLLSNALRASTTLTSLQMTDAVLWHDPAAVVLLLSSLTGHQSLRELRLSSTYDAERTPAMQAIAGAALAAVVATNAPALQVLSLTAGIVGDVGMGSLVDALPRNTHLRTLLYTGITRLSHATACCRRCMPTPRFASWYFSMNSMHKRTRPSCTSCKTWSRRARRRRSSRSRPAVRKTAA